MLENFASVEIFTQVKKNYYKSQSSQSELIGKHLDQLKISEEEYFSSTKLLNSSVHEVIDINDEIVVNQVKALSPDFIALFGTPILKPIWINAFKNRIINLHLGLSPFYRGSATLFWPFFYRELVFLGTTIHIAVDQVDAGSILARIQPDFYIEDDYYSITNRLIHDSIRRMPQIITSYLKGEISPTQQEKISGSRLCKKADFNEQALRTVNEFFQDEFNKDYIDKVMLSRCQY
jgi:methionyl-tRNA formyltransferase